MPVVFNPQDRYEILTPSGFESFTGIQKLTKPMMVELRFEDDIIPPFCCSPKHRVQDVAGNLIFTKDLIGGEPLLHSELGTVVVSDVIPVPGEVVLYDVLDAGKEKLFYTDGLVSHNCEFIGSSDTLISGERLKVMVWRKPIAQKRLRFDTSNYLDIHQHPEPRKIYALVADVGSGTGGDYSAFSVIEITTFPYTVVAKYRSNDVKPLLFADVIYEAAVFYNNALVLVEVNDLGIQVANSLHSDLEYEFLISTANKGQQGPSVGGGFGKNVEFGLRTNKATKKIGCANLKTMIETEKLIVEDFQIYQEFLTFVANTKGSYSAEEGKHDDLVMTLVNFAWLVTQPYFKELSENDIYQKLKDDYEKSFEDDLLPFGYRGDDDLDDDGLKL